MKRTMAKLVFFSLLSMFYISCSNARIKSIEDYIHENTRVITAAHYGSIDIIVLNQLSTKNDYKGIINILCVDKDGKITDSQSINNNSPSVLLGANEQYFICSTYLSSDAVVYNKNSNQLQLVKMLIPALGQLIIVGDYAYGSSDMGPPILINLQRNEVQRYEKMTFYLGSLYVDKGRVYFFSDPLFNEINQGVELLSDGTWRTVNYNKKMYEDSLTIQKTLMTRSNPIVTYYSEKYRIQLYKY